MNTDNNETSKKYLAALVLLLALVVGGGYFLFMPNTTSVQVSQTEPDVITPEPLQQVLPVTEESLAKVVVYKSPTCGCCSKWIDHLQAAGFEVEAHDRDNMSRIKAELGIGRPLQSCHTALVDGYTIEGHVPAEDIIRLLKQRPEVSGLSVPGMPIGSPGMEANYIEPYDVVAFDKAGNTETFTEYRVEDLEYVKINN